MSLVIQPCGAVVCTHLHSPERFPTCMNTSRGPFPHTARMCEGAHSGHTTQGRFSWCCPEVMRGRGSFEKERL